ncbi:MAG: GH92 family glycosyl hydrolase [Bacteroidota bacterium]
MIASTNSWNSIYLFIFSFLLVLLARCTQPGQLSETSTVDFVDPFIGTAVATTPSAIKHSVSGSELRGQNYPAVGVPHGMTQWTPETQPTEIKCKSPYYYEDSVITGFRGTHWMSGSCTQDYGSVSIMPVTGELSSDVYGRGSSFQKSSEAAKPNYYKVSLDKYDIEAELAAVSRAGILRLNFKGNEDPKVVITPNSDEGFGFVRVDVERQMVVGYNPVHRIYQGWGEDAGFSGYFAIKFSEPIAAFGVITNDKIIDNQQEVQGDSSMVSAFVTFGKTKEILVKVGTSFTSVEGAIKNLEAEIPDWNFEKVSEKSKQSWNEVLSKVRVKGDDDDQKLFYTALYHSYLLPRVFSDVDGKYVGFAEDEDIHQADNDYYVDFSMWDTFRGVHPLMTILEPEKSSDMINSLLLKAQQGEWLPIFPAWNNYTAAMIGDHVISMICDADAKGIDDFDKEVAWEYMRKNAFTYNEDKESYISGKGRRVLNTYLEYDYIPMEEKVPYSFHKQEQVSRTLEYAYDDFVLSEFAKRHGKVEYQALKKRGRNWENVFDKSTGYVRGKYQDGSWYEPFDPNATRTPFITEGTPFQYTWYVPQDVYGLMAAMGGKEKFTERLDVLFDTDEYWHGNEPGHQTAYMYAYSGSPWKTQKWVYDIIKAEYGIGPGGLSGNEDAGQMSAWLVFSMMGFYPVCPGTPYYIIGTPAFEEIQINMNGGTTFTIQANNISDQNHFIQSATLDGQPFNRSWIDHDELVKGGTLIFNMGSQPNESWASDENSLPVDVININ